MTHGISERLRVGDRRSGIDRAHITWFSFEGEFVVDYPTLLRPAGSKRPQGAERLNVHPNTISKIRRDITFDGRK